MSRIYFTNIFATSENGCFVGGDVMGKVNRVYFNNVRLRRVRVTSYDNSFFDLRPRRGDGFVKTRGMDSWSSKATDCELEVKLVR